MSCASLAQPLSRLPTKMRQSRWVRDAGTTGRCEVFCPESPRMHSAAGGSGMSEMMISADDHIDLGYLPGDLWTERLPSQFRERGPHVEERDGRELWICDDRVWSEWRL